MKEWEAGIATHIQLHPISWKGKKARKWAKKVPGAIIAKSSIDSHSRTDEEEVDDRAASRAGGGKKWLSFHGWGRVAFL